MRFLKSSLFLAAGVWSAAFVVGKGSNDMTIQAVDKFNSGHPAPPASYQIQVQNHSLTINKPSYFSTSGNADLNGDHILQGNEADPYGAVGQFNWNWVGRVEHVTVDTVNGKKVITGHPFPGFSDNDTAVSVVSARYPPLADGTPGFEEINGTPYSANHASILCPSIGLVLAFCAPILGSIVDVLTNIRQTEAKLNVTVQ